MRAFLSVPIGKNVCQNIEKILGAYRADPILRIIRWVQPFQYHLTLKFLGDISEESGQKIIETLHSPATETAPFVLKTDRVGAFPNIRRPRVLWIGIEDPSGALAQFQRSIERSLASLGYASEDRPFHPHLTIGRVKGDISSNLAFSLTQLFEDSALKQSFSFPVNRMDLMKSALGPSGPSYSVLEGFQFQGSLAKIND